MLKRILKTIFCVKQIRQAAAYEIKTLILVQRTRYAMFQAEIVNDKDLWTWQKYQDKITALADLQTQIEEKFNLKTK